MERKKAIFLIIAVALICAVSASVITYTVTVKKFNTGELFLRTDSYQDYIDYYEFKNIKNMITEHYGREISPDSGTVYMSGAVNGFISNLNDGHSAYFTKEEYSLINEAYEGSKLAQGLMVSIDSATGYPIVEHVLSDSAASEADIREGDIILAFDDTSAYNMNIDLVMAYIRGEHGSVVNLKIRRNNQNIYMMLVRRNTVQNVVEARDITENCRYIKIREFSGTVENELISEFLQCKNKNILIDLRGVNSGIFNTSVSCADLLIDKGTIISICSNGETVNTIEAKEGVYTASDVILLVDSETAGAAEVFTKALIMNGRARVAGTPTAANAVATTTYLIPSTENYLRLVTGYYGSSWDDLINNGGINPDIDIKEYISEDDTVLLKKIANNEF